MKVRSLWLFVLMAVPGAVYAQSGGRFPLRGHLVDGITHGPVAGVPVILEKDSEYAARPISSDADGSFTFPNLEPGTYRLTAVIAGEKVHYHELADRRSAPVEIVPGREPRDVLFPVLRHASISGIIRDEYGEPAPAVEVQAFRREWSEGRLVFSHAASNIQTDDRGRYRIMNLPAGEYFLCANAFFLASDSTTRIAPPIRVADFKARSERRYRTRSCYPSNPPASFRLDWAADRAIDLKIASAAATPLRGRITNLAGPAEVWVNWEDTKETVAIAVANIADGQFEIDSVEPGRYIIRATGSGPIEGPLWTATQAFSMDGTKELALTMQPPGRIKLSFVSPLGAPPPSDAIYVDLRSVQPSPFRPIGSTA